MFPGSPEQLMAGGEQAVLSAAGPGINPVPLLAVSARHPGVWVALGSAGWLRTPGCFPLGSGADQVVQLWQAAPQAHKPLDAWGWSRGGGKHARFALGFILLVMRRGSCGKPGALALCVPFGSTKGQIAASSRHCSTPGAAQSPALPCCTLCAGEGFHG